VATGFDATYTAISSALEIGRTTITKLMTESHMEKTPGTVTR
jgi:hypothetical protein